MNRKVILENKEWDCEEIPPFNFSQVNNPNNWMDIEHLHLWRNKKEPMETKTELKELSFESIENVVMSAIDGFHESLAQAQTEYLEEHNAPFSYAYDCNEFRMQALIEVKKLIKTAFREQLKELQNKAKEQDRFKEVDKMVGNAIIYTNTSTRDFYVKDLVRAIVKIVEDGK